MRSLAGGRLEAWRLVLETSYCGMAWLWSGKGVSRIFCAPPAYLAKPTLLLLSLLYSPYIALFLVSHAELQKLGRLCKRRYVRYQAEGPQFFFIRITLFYSMG